MSETFTDNPVWPSIQRELRRAVGESTYDLWLAALQLRSTPLGGIVVSAPESTRAWVTHRFGAVIESCAQAVLGEHVTVTVVGADDTTTDPGAREPAPRSRQAAVTPASLNPKYTFGQFVIGDSNRMAHAAALAVAELPAQAYNPLFIYGAPGLGKTHLLHAIGNYVTGHGDGARVRYATVETFTNHFLNSLQSGSTDAFKSAYRDTDVLLIDDIQFLESKAKTEEEFFHTFNALYETGSQLVLTSDRPPRDLLALEDRLRERFESGLVTDVHPPDLPTRMTILRKRVRHDEVELSDESALESIASRITANVRALEGALVRVVAFHSLTRRPIDGALADEVLEVLYPGTRPARRSVFEVQQATCEEFGLTLPELLSASRAPRYSWPRQVAMYLARELTDETLPAIGREFGGRNHATVLHACRRACARIGADREAFDAVQHITATLHARS